jgi:hypothetical protein
VRTRAAAVEEVCANGTAAEKYPISFSGASTSSLGVGDLVVEPSAALVVSVATGVSAEVGDSADVGVPAAVGASAAGGVPAAVEASELVGELVAAELVLEAVGTEGVGSPAAFGS